jgi:DNA mismatch repair enzyme (predicted ATPase)
MSKQKVTITDTSIMSGVTSDPKKAICEYIWNGFDANATSVSIEYEATELGAITSLVIRDDGDGIIRSQLHETFGKYQDSIKKKSFQWSSQVKGKKGKGRYSFNCFASRATWTSIYKEGERLLKHTISIDEGENDHYNDHSDEGGQVIVHNEDTGTVVNFSNVRLTRELFESKDFIDYLKKEYAVFLKLNENGGKSLLINGVPLDYETIIAETDARPVKIEDDDNYSYHFNLTFIRWKEKTKENYSVYYLNEEGLERYEETTKLNRKDTGFHHSVYVTSDYFENFGPSSKAKSAVDPQLAFEGITILKTEKDKVFRHLHKRVADWIATKEKEFVQKVAGNELWNKYEKSGVVEIPSSEYDLPLYNDLKDTVTGIYSVQPKIFQNLKNDSAKALVGCLKLLLQTNKREDVLSIIESINKMTDDERHRLAKVLKTTEMSSITNTIEMLENRYRTVSALRAMVFDESLQAYEVADVQKLVSKAFWLFGEQYNIVAEEETDFQQAMEKYLEMIHGDVKGISKSRINEEKIKHPDVNKEMDIFAFRQTMDSQTIENIVVELKRPNVKLGEIEVSQIKTYKNLIFQQPQFNSTSARWTFILVGNKPDQSGFIKSEKENSVHWGKKDLIQHGNNDGVIYEIYVKTWSSIFDDFEMRYKFLMDRLKFKREELSAKYSNKQNLHDIVNEAQESEGIK